MMEWEVLQLCARPALADNEIVQFKSHVEGELDWEFLLQTASRHALLPMLCAQLRKHCSGMLTEEIALQLKDISFSSSARSLFQTGVLLQILKLLREKDIPSLAFKGPILAVTVYGDIGRRNFSDLDILIERNTLQQTCDLFLSLGYLPELQLGPEELVAYSRHEDNLSFSNSNNNMIVELHWDMAGAYLAQPLGYEKIADVLEEIRVSGHVVSNLQKEYLLVYLCVHGAKHMWERLEWVAGVAGLCNTTQEIDWELTFAFAAEQQCQRMVLLGVLLAHTLLGVHLPDSIMRQIRADKRLDALVEQVNEIMFAAKGKKGGTVVNKRFSFFHMLVRDSTVDSIRYFFRLYFRPTNVEWQTVRLPAPVAFLYYFVRPVRLMGEYFGWRYR